MRHVKICILISLIACFGCNTSKPQSTMNTVETNGLSAADRAVGWKSLFNGKDMSQWRVYKEKEVRGWKVSDGQMIALGIEGNAADIITKDTFSNMELSLEWKIASGGNSGIFFNVREGDSYDAVYHTGPEYQLLDNIAYEGKIHKSQKCGANYDMQVPSVDATKPAGSWNHTRLIVNKEHVQHWLNGKLVVQYTFGSDAWQAQKEKSKWKDLTSYAAFRSGHIALQDHGQQTSFRNIKIRRL